MAQFSILTLGLVLLLASLVAIVSRRVKLPYTVGLVVAGIDLGLLPTGIRLPLTHDLIFSVFLPPLIFEAALQLKWQPFRHNLLLTGSLAFPGVVIAAGCVALGMHLLVGWSWLGAGLFGVLIAATDPVSVIAFFKEVAVEPRLSMIVESESILNDGGAAIGFAALVAVAAGGALTPTAIAFSLIWSIAGGIAAGLLVAGAILLIARGTEDHLVEITLTTIAAYGSFLAAEHFGASGVLAALSAGLLVGNAGLTTVISESGRTLVIAFWEYAAFLANSVVFILIGTHEAYQPIQLATGTAAVAIVLVLLGRILAVYPLCTLFKRSRLKPSLAYQHVLVWGGLRGALALALALSLPDAVAERQEIVVVAFAVVAFSVFVQGLTMPVLVRRLGLVSPRP